MALHGAILDKFAAFDKTNLPVVSPDDCRVTRNASSPALDALAKHLQAAIASGLKKADIAKTAGMDVKTVTRIAAKENEPSTDKVSGIAKALGKEPWELLHPDGGITAPTLESSIKHLAEALRAMDGPARVVAQAKLRTVIDAFDSAYAVEEAAKALSAESGLGGGLSSEFDLAPRRLRM